MKSQFSKILLASTIALGAIVSPALAEPEETGKGWYLTVGSGIYDPNEPDIEYSEDNVLYAGEAEFTQSFTGDLGAGYDFGNWRAELTYGYTPMSSDSLDLSGGGITTTAPLAFDVRSHSLQGGVYYDFNEIKVGGVNPYVGGSIGMARVTMDETTFTLDGVDYTLDSDTDMTLTYELKGGVSYAASERTDVFAEAGYKVTGEADYDVVTCAAGSTCSDVEIEEFGGFVAKVGFRYRL